MKIRLAIFCSDSVQCSKFEWNGKMQRKLVVSQGRVPTAAAAAASLNEGHEGTWANIFEWKTNKQRPNDKRRWIEGIWNFRLVRRLQYKLLTANWKESIWKYEEGKTRIIWKKGVHFAHNGNGGGVAWNCLHAGWLGVDFYLFRFFTP